jgi:hypothetical protein
MVCTLLDYYPTDALWHLNHISNDNTFSMKIIVT